jgi:hypothetical protein
MSNISRALFAVVGLVMLVVALQLRVVLERECVELGGQPDGAMCWFGSHRSSLD